MSAGRIHALRACIYLLMHVFYLQESENVADEVELCPQEKLNETWKYLVADGVAVGFPSTFPEDTINYICHIFWLLQYCQYCIS